VNLYVLDLNGRVTASFSGAATPDVLGQLVAAVDKARRIVP